MNAMSITFASPGVGWNPIAQNSKLHLVLRCLLFPEAEWWLVIASCVSWFLTIIVCTRISLGGRPGDS